MTHAWLDVTRNAGIARIVRMSYRSKTYTWNDVILVKRIILHLPAYEDGTECCEMSAYKIQTPGNYPEENIRHTVKKL